MLAPKRRLLLGFMIVLLLFFGLMGAAAVPFYFESATILYKFGHDKLLLRSAQVIGVVAGYLLILQIVLGARLKILDRIFGLNNLFRFHRYIGLIIAVLVLIHPVLIFISDNRFSIPLQLRYWPEFVGLFLVLSIILMVFSSHWRVRLKLPFHRWWPIHRAAAILIAAAFWVHLINVSETFERGFPQMAAFVFIGLCAYLFLWIRTRSLRNRRKSLAVSEIKAVAENAIRLEIKSPADSMPAFIPGQFGFLRCIGPNISREEHPFTIASSPTVPSSLEFIIRIAGDWTGQLNNLQPGDKVMFDGPFGLFSHIWLPEKTEIIMIAGGIGITPMLSMLRYMADCGDHRKITLIWSNRTRKQIVMASEFEKLADRLRNLRIFHVLTRESGAAADSRRLDRGKIEKFTSDCSKSAAAFVCGPAPMTADTFAALVSLGFEKPMIFRERFSL